MSSEENKKLKEFYWPVRVYYEDTDSGGVVYYANYLKFMERARTELLRSIGYQQDQLQQELGVIFAVHSANIQYKKPARFNDELNVITSITLLGKASICFQQSIYLKSTPGTELSTTNPVDLLSKAEIKIACLNAKKFTPQSIPASITKKINKEFYCGS
ncbi:MAG: tol-pal system-associated acyl-CoA thioesterase [Gammaproteobacteria bacterium]|nr:tol-pal system-associated acyl-CoA thioesterase [Gammaproteobacteria bacterium]